LGQPLILTLQLEEPGLSFYEGLRRTYFPAERNFIPAHITLFHQLPDVERSHEILRECAAGVARFSLVEPEVRSIGRGVAVFFQSQSASVLHASLSAKFVDDLIAQDRQRFRPHVVVQNKVDGETARQTLLNLRSSSLVQLVAAGLTLWRYLGGPWEHVRDIPFSSAAQK
jgi:hypothetical protein